MRATNAVILCLQRTFYYCETFFSMNMLFYSMTFDRNMAWWMTEWFLFGHGEYEDSCFAVILQYWIKKYYNDAHFLKFFIGLPWPL